MPNEGLSVAEMFCALAEHIEGETGESWAALHKLVIRLAISFESAKLFNSKAEIFYYWFDDDSVLRFEHSDKKSSVLALKFCE